MQRYPLNRFYDAAIAEMSGAAITVLRIAGYIFRQKEFFDPPLLLYCIEGHLGALIFDYGFFDFYLTQRISNPWLSGRWFFLF